MNKSYPMLPLRDVVVYPHLVIPLFVGREKSITAIEKANDGDKKILLVAQKSANQDEPKSNDLYKIGTLATIIQTLKLPDGTVKVLVEGLQRANIKKLTQTEDFWTAQATLVKTREPKDKNTTAFMRSVFSQFDQYVKLNKKIPPEILSSLTSITEPGRLADSIAANLSLKLSEKQKILETFEVKKRLNLLLELMEAEIDILQVEKKIRGRVKKQMEKSQREYYLNEQVKAIQKELGDSDEGAEFDELQDKINSTEMSSDAKEKCLSELKKLKMMSPMSAEASVVRTYIETIVNLPWSKSTKINHDLSAAEITLDNDHYGLDKVKERIVEYLAVQQRVDKLKAPILCLVGPPGVGKTSLGQSIAKAINRKFIRMALGGVRDEAEIRGHRRTYIGSMPGKILQNMTKAGVTNPLFLLDEVDKMGQDFRGDPSSALLEVLDPEQNHTFNDHYAEIEYDLSNVMFVATANSMNIPEPLLDRMEIIRLPGYTEAEKASIAKKHLLPKQLQTHGLKKSEIKVTSKAIKDIIQYYSREAGVRKLEQEISKICRKAVKKLLTNKKIKSINVNNKNIQDYLGVKIFDIGLASKKNQIGQVTGLAWTQVGGELLTIETVVVPGKGKTIITGKLGDVMQESIHAAMSVVRSRADALGIESDFYETKDIHIHFPEGATPKDGPSAGIGITTAIISSLTSIPVFNDVAMTGEITLRGEVLAIGGLKEKLLAAHRGNLKKILIPEQNMKDLVDIPSDVKDSLSIVPVRWIDQVIELALTRKPSKKKGKTKTSHDPEKKYVRMDKPISH
ncbi:MAG: endopeptidase La [Nitrosomonadales bacterium]|jgi:ATP-dependent Lon protease|nr:endopeptidase La [Nitrosomonadales bacterium]MBT4182813.1 endopeptidase La [Nitrosomonadales bacterium]MBT4570810.1 endopeptidase La [Nitrosomonadales bacterium]MBT5150124.1 endopeptidase La [Nitrosomonadales bacterium]MBT5572899.1 endopeptidase La [Nitrosomonadales bacterium]